MLFRNKVHSQQARSAKFQAEIAVNKRVLKKLALKSATQFLLLILNLQLPVAGFYPAYSVLQCKTRQ